MIFRSGKYKGYSFKEVQYLDPGYINWVRENRPEMLRSNNKPTKTQPKTQPKDPDVEPNQYRNLPLGSWEDAF